MEVFKSLFNINKRDMGSFGWIAFLYFSWILMSHLMEDFTVIANSQ